MIPDPTPLIGPTLVYLDFAGMAVFAATGALAGARLRQDLVTIGFFAAVTGVGGGTLRDLLIGAPVFWVHDWRYVAVAMAVAVVIWFVGGKGWRMTALLWLDAVGLAAYGVIGAAKAMAYGVPPLICIVMGALTACFGGVVRDLLAGQPSVLLQREIVITAALVAAASFVGLRMLDATTFIAAAVAVTLGFGLRAGALHFGWSLPAFSPGRPEGSETPS